MDWETFVTSLSAEDQERWMAFFSACSYDEAARRVRYHLARSLGELAVDLHRERQRVRSRVVGLYESLDLGYQPEGFTFNDNNIQPHPGGRLVASTGVSHTNGSHGFFEMGFDAANGMVELLEAFMLQPGETASLPSPILGGHLPLTGRGTPTVQYLTLYLLKMLGVPVGSQSVTQMKLSRIQNVRTILHLHWLVSQHPAAALHDLVAHTETVDYATTVATQCGYRVTGISLAEIQQEPIKFFMDHQEGENQVRRTRHEELLVRYGYNRDTVMRSDFDIYLTLAPL